MYFIARAAILLASYASFTNSLPTHDLDASDFANITQRGGGGSPVYCAYPVEYDLSMAPLLMYGNPSLITGITVGPDPAGAEISAGYTYSTAKVFSGGLSAGASANAPDSMAEAVAKASFGFSLTWTKGTAVSGIVMCPANVTCGLTAAGQYLHVEGIETMRYCGYNGMTDPNAYPCQYPANPACEYPGVPANVPQPFSANYPVKFDNSLVDGQDNVVTEFNACAMGYPDGGLTQCPSGTELPPGMTCNLPGCTTATCQDMCTNLNVPGPNPTCQWSAALNCYWCNCQPYFANLGGGSGRGSS